MDYNISDFSLVHKALQILCKRLDCDFIDLPVKFDTVEEPSYTNGAITVKKTNLLDTMAFIYSAYVNSLGEICGRNLSTMESRHSLTNLFLSMLRDFKTEYGEKHLFDDSDSFNMRLDQFHAVWILLKNVFCPYKQIPLVNARVVASKAGDVDAALFINEQNIPENIKGKTDVPFIFVNLDIEKNSIRSAFLLVESLRLHMQEESPESLIREIFSNFFTRDRMMDFLGMAFLEDAEVANFLAVLSILCQSQDIEDLAMGLNKITDVKVAQVSSYNGNWWFLGLTEKMMDGVRGPDWSTTQNLKDFSKDLWDKVEVERKRRGMSELPFELLLRVQSEELKTNPNQTLQELLSKTRIW